MSNVQGGTAKNKFNLVFAALGPLNLCFGFSLITRNILTKIIQYEFVKDEQR